MSRFSLAGDKPRTNVDLGWDAPMGTFFAQVYRLDQKGEEEEHPSVWLGGQFDEYTTLEAFEAALKPHLTLTPEVKERLAEDKRTRNMKIEGR